MSFICQELWYDENTCIKISFKFEKEKGLYLKDK